MENTHLKPIQAQPVTFQNPRSLSGKKKIIQPFSSHLQQAMQPKKLTISKHAKERLEERGIEISRHCWNEIEDKVQQAKKMGVKDSLILLHDAALIVSAKNNTVITAMDRKEAQTQIFTNINGTIVLE